MKHHFIYYFFYVFGDGRKCELDSHVNKSYFDEYFE